MILYNDNETMNNKGNIHAWFDIETRGWDYKFQNCVNDGEIEN